MQARSCRVGTSGTNALHCIAVTLAPPPTHPSLSISLQRTRPTRARLSSPHTRVLETHAFPAQALSDNYAELRRMQRLHERASCSYRQRYDGLWYPFCRPVLWYLFCRPACATPAHLPACATPTHPPAGAEPGATDPVFSRWTCVNDNVRA